MKPQHITSDLHHREISKHLEHELSMLLDAARKCRPVGTSSDSFLYVECFLLHARNLIAFLFDAESTNPDYDDVLAEHFCSDVKTWTKERGQNTVLHQARQDAHKYLAHVTYSREAPKDWRVREISNELSKTFNRFLRHANPEWILDGVRANASELAEITSELPTFSSTFSSTGPSSTKFRSL